MHPLGYHHLPPFRSVSDGYPFLNQSTMKRTVKSHPIFVYSYTFALIPLSPPIALNKLTLLSEFDGRLPCLLTVYHHSGSYPILFSSCNPRFRFPRSALICHRCPGSGMWECRREPYHKYLQSVLLQLHDAGFMSYLDGLFFLSQIHY